MEICDTFLWKRQTFQASFWESHSSGEQDSVSGCLLTPHSNDESIMIPAAPSVTLIPKQTGLYKELCIYRDLLVVIILNNMIYWCKLERVH